MLTRIAQTLGFYRRDTLFLWWLAMWSLMLVSFAVD